jgi:hypothetical protein
MKEEMSKSEFDKLMKEAREHIKKLTEEHDREMAKKFKKSH